jgi:hypothetical protein
MNTTPKQAGFWARLFGLETKDSATLTAILNETAALRKRLAPKILSGLSDQDVSLAAATLRKAEKEWIKRLAAGKRRNELYVDWGSPDELIHLAGLIIEEARQLRIVMNLNQHTTRLRF